ncbi:MAG: signal peptide peptidase SppA [Myxococcota bacterium]
MKRFRRLLIAALIGLVLYWWFVPSGGPQVQPGSILMMNVEGRYVEASEAPILARMLGEGRRPFAGLLSNLRMAERDDRLGAVVLRIRDLDIGWGKAQELREAISALEAAGRKTVAYLELAAIGANLEYYVAAAADEVVLSPAARVPVIGLAAEYLFLGGLWESMGVDLEVERIGRYKTFADTFARRSMSEAHREMAESLLDSIDAQFVGGIAESRNLSEDFVRRAIEMAAMTPDEMRALGLIDGTRFEDEIVADLGGGPVVKGSDYAAIDPSNVGFDPVARFALVYGSGAVVTGRGSSSRTGEPVLASETVSQALTDAAEDPEIRAILFRIDSPGGSALASDVVWRATQTARKNGKPLIVSFSDVAASGGYYVATGADAIVASAGTITGSIGVVVLRPVIGRLLEKFDIGFESLTRGAHADLALSTEPLSEGSRERLRLEVTSIYDLFVERVAAGRSLAAERVNEIGRGRVWTGAQALEVGLVDELGGLRAASRRAKVAAGIDPDADVALVPYPRPQNLAEQLNSALHRVAASAAPTLPLPRLVRTAAQWLTLAPIDAPALLPPVVLDIH